MSIAWARAERAIIEQGIADHGIHTGRCAALARIVYGVAKPRDEHTRALHVKPAPGARYLVPKPPHVPYWGSHTYVETERHAVDAIVGPDGHPAERFLEDHWVWSHSLRVSEVDPASIDPGIQDADRET